MSFSIICAWMARNGVRAFAALTLAALVCTLAFFNVKGWLAADLQILAVLAALFEAIAFVMAIMCEDAIRARRIDRALVCGAILIGAGLFNAVGGERAWDASMAPRMQRDREAAQAALDRTRAELQDQIAAARAEISGYADLLPAADAPKARQDGMMAGWNIATADSRARARNAQARLDALPIVADAAAPFPRAIVLAFLAFLEVAKCLGLWALGMNVRAAARLDVVDTRRAASGNSFAGFNAGRELVRKRWAARAAA